MADDVKRTESGPEKIFYCVACEQPYQPKHRNHRYCSKDCHTAYRRNSSGNYSPPAYVGNYDLLPEHIKRNFTPGDPEKCWPYALRSPNGYAVNTSVNMFKGNAYRLVYMLMVGPIPEGKVLHHTCNGGPQGCVNWHHLQVVTQRENMLASRSFVTIQAAQTHCKRGHLLDNPVKRQGKRANQRNCRECNKLYTAIKAMIPPPVYCSYCKGNLGPDQIRARRHYCDTCKAKFLQTALDIGEVG